LTAIRDNNSNFWITPAQATSNEINELMRTDAFIRAVVQQTVLEENMSEGPETVSEVFDYVRKNVWVTPLGNKQVQVNASDPEAETAYQLVNALIQSYIQWNISSERTDILAAEEFISQLIEEYSVNLKNARQELKDYVIAHPEPIRGERHILETYEIERLNGDIRIAEDLYLTALSKEEDIKISLQQVDSEARQTFVLIDAPIVPEDPSLSKRNIALNVGIFFVVGLFLSSAMIVGSVLLDRSIRFSSDISLHLEMPLLAEIYNAKPKKEPGGNNIFEKIKNWRKTSGNSDRQVIESTQGEISYQETDQEFDTAL
jgi:capsular polysaccharide biosynthesis protein